MYNRQSIFRVVQSTYRIFVVTSYYIATVSYIYRNKLLHCYSIVYLSQQAITLLQYRIFIVTSYYTATVSYIYRNKLLHCYTYYRLRLD